MTYYSQTKQDHFLDYFFSKKEQGIFVDVGAHDGITFSNSYFFEKHRNWKGLCVEPIPEVFAALDKNRNCLKANCCISAQNGTEKFLRIKGYAEMLSGIYSNYEERHLQRIEEELKEFDGEKELIEVKAYTLANLLKKNEIAKVDFLSLDVEGSEMVVLNSIDFSACEFSIIMFENNYDESEIGGFLKNKGFKFLRRLGKDDVYLNGKAYNFITKGKAKLYNFLS